MALGNTRPQNPYTKPGRVVGNVFPAKPENVGRLPSNISGNLSGLKLAAAPVRLAASGSLPSAIPGNFNNIRLDPPIPYGSVGYTVICRSVSDFSTILAIFYDYSNLSYSEELNGVGAGSITLNLDDPLIQNQLLNGNDPEVLLAKDNLWQFYFDGERRFQWLGQNIKEPKVDESESRQVTISGPGGGKILEWALVLPNTFNGAKDKLADAVHDDFLGTTLNDYTVWTDNGGTVQNVGGKVAVKVTAAGGNGSWIGTANNYDFTESGAQAFVTPAIVLGNSSGAGKIRTTMSVEEDENNYAKMFTDLDANDSTKVIIVVQTKGPSGSNTSSVNYNPSTMNYWRIQELDGRAIFSYRPQNSDENGWVTIASLPYSFNPNSVSLKLRASGVAGGNITFPQTSYFSLVNVDGIGSPIVPLEKFKNLLKKAQKRGTIKQVSTNWTADADSMGASWQENPTVTVNVEADLLAVLDDICSALQVDWFMDADFRLHVRQRVWSPTGNDPTAPYHKEKKVIFYEAESQNSKERTRAYSNVRNYVVGKTESDAYVVKTDSASISKFQQRETIVSNTVQTREETSLDTVLSNTLASVKGGSDSWTLNVPHDIPGKQLYKDYQLGDWIGVQSTFPHRLDTWRIVAISVQMGADGNPEVELTLNDKLTPYWYKFRDDMNKNKFHTKPGTIGVIVGRPRPTI